MKQNQEVHVLTESIYPDYREYYAPAGTKYYVDRKDGSCHLAVTQEVPSGTKIQTPAEVARCKMYAKERAAILEKSHMLAVLRIRENPLGKFVFYYFRRDAGAILKPASLARLALLATYVRADGRLMKSKRLPMTKDDAAKKLGLSNATFARFWKEVTETGCLAEDEERSLTVSSGIFFRGKAPKTGEDTGWMKIFIDQMRALYYATPAAQHHYLGMVLQMIPYVNVQYNILCWNPWEENVEEIAPMSMAELCREMDKSASNADQYRKAYAGITFEMGGCKRRFCQIARNDDGKELIFIDPRVFFAGANWERADAMIQYFADPQQHSRPHPGSIPLFDGKRTEFETL